MTKLFENTGRKTAFQRFLYKKILALLETDRTENIPLTVSEIQDNLHKEGIFVSKNRLTKVLQKLREDEKIIESTCGSRKGYCARIPGEKVRMSGDDVRGWIWNETSGSFRMSLVSILAALLIFLVFFFTPRGDYRMIAVMNTGIIVIWGVLYLVLFLRILRFRRIVKGQVQEYDPSGLEQLNYTNGRFFKYFIVFLYGFCGSLGTQILKIFHLSSHREIITASSLQAFTAFLSVLVFLVLILTAGSRYLVSSALYHNKDYGIRLKGAWIGSAFYFAAIGVLFLLVKGDESSIETRITFTAILYFVVCGMIYIWKQSRIEMKKGISRKYRRMILGVLIAAALFQYMRTDHYYLLRYIGSIESVEHEADTISYHEDSGVYTITTEKEQFKILQLTDIHLGCSYLSRNLDLKALQDCYTVIQREKPDLIIVTGDLAFSAGVSSFSLNNTSCVWQFAQMMRNIGIPWAFTYGNHDTGDLANGSREEIDELYTELSFRNSGVLLYPYVKPDISGRCNQLIEIRNTDGSLREAVFLIDSNDYTGKQINDYDYIHDDQVQWYAAEVKRLEEEEGDTPESLIFTHIPLHEYQTAYDLYQEGSDEVEYCFGKMGTGFMVGIGTSAYHSSLFEKMVELDSTHAFFCGHDHLNDFSIIYKGIRLTYGMSIDYLTRPVVRKYNYQRGGTVIDISEDGSYEVKQSPVYKE